MQAIIKWLEFQRAWPREEKEHNRFKNVIMWIKCLQVMPSITLSKWSIFISILNWEKNLKSGFHKCKFFASHIVKCYYWEEGKKFCMSGLKIGISIFCKSNFDKFPSKRSLCESQNLFRFFNAHLFPIKDAVQNH